MLRIYVTYFKYITLEKEIRGLFLKFTTDANYKTQKKQGLNRIVLGRELSQNENIVTLAILKMIFLKL